MQTLVTIQTARSLSIFGREDKVQLAANRCYKDPRQCGVEKNKQDLVEWYWQSAT
jgi:hypothetical protein